MAARKLGEVDVRFLAPQILNTLSHNGLTNTEHFTVNQAAVASFPR